MQTNQHYYSIDIFRYVCAIMVVAIHTHPFNDINELLGYFFTSIVPRVAVPFFFSVAGYFYFKKLIDDKPIFISYIKRLLLSYLTCSCFYYVIDFITNVINGSDDLISYIITCIKHLLIGSHYHLWFFPALILSVIFATLIYKIGKTKLLLPIILISILLYLIGCLSCTYYSIGIQIPVLLQLINQPFFVHIFRFFFMAFPFFFSGYIVLIIEKCNRIKHYYIGLICSVTIYLLEMFLTHHFQISERTTISLALYPLVVIILLILLQHPAPKLQSLSKACKTLASFTYYFHPAFMLLITFIATNCINTTITETPLFLLTVLFTCIIGLCIFILNNQYINKKIG